MHQLARGHQTLEREPAQQTNAPAGFINEMRMVAMKLHTKEQAPKEGGIESPPKPQPVSDRDRTASKQQH
jgi:heme oxygenase